MVWTLPNLLTLFRLVAAPAVAMVFVILPRPAADWAGLVLFVTASATDYIDGAIARRRGQVTKIGTMLDPIADKAMVVIALAVLLGVSSLAAWLLLPAALILFREVFVSGLREYLGDVAGTLKVTRLAKGKTLIQMVAISVLFAHGLFEHYLGMRTIGMDARIIEDVLAGRVPDEVGLRLAWHGTLWSGPLGLGLLWLATGLTLLSGADYLRKAAPHLKEEA
jgi:cardiolipin synthase